jgi:hypothetical protein
VELGDELRVEQANGRLDSRLGDEREMDFLGLEIHCKD